MLFCYRPNFSLRPDPPPTSSAHLTSRPPSTPSFSGSVTYPYQPSCSLSPFNRTPRLPTITAIGGHILRQTYQETLPSYALTTDLPSPQASTSQLQLSEVQHAASAVQKQPKKVRLIQVPPSELPSRGAARNGRPLRPTRPRPPRHPPYSPMYQFHKEVKHLFFLLLMVILAVVICVLLYLMLKQRRELTRKLIKDRYFT